MSARKWPFYTLEVGQAETVDNPPRRFNVSVWRYGYATGKRFSVKRVERLNPSSPKVVRRIA